MINTNFYVEHTVFIQLLKRDWYIFKQQYTHRVKMALHWVLLTIFVTKIFMPSMGLQHYGPLILINSVISYGFFVAMHNATNLVDDIINKQLIVYELTLPIRPIYIFYKFVVSTMVQALIISLSIMPFGLIVLFDLHPFKDFSLLKLSIIFVCSTFFYGCFGLIFSSFITNLQKVENVWARIVFPLWYLGCFQFSWKTLYSISPHLAYLDLLNPLTYIMEGARSATIDSAGSLPFFMCCTMIVLYAMLAAYFGIYWMKKRLDCL